MRPEIEKYLLDILQSADLLISRTSDINSFEDYQMIDELVKDGILRRFSIIGEVVNVLNNSSIE